MPRRSKTPTKRPKKRAAPRQEEGGRFALVGYVQQLLGSAADFVRTISPSGKDGYRDFGVLFEIEAHGQDQSEVCVTPGGQRRRVLTQYKYSMTGRKICKPEMVSIAEVLRLGKRTANATEALTTELVLCTNRELSGPARSALMRSQIKLLPYLADEMREQLGLYAGKFGLLDDDELERGVGRVIQRFIETVVGGTGDRRIDQRVFDKALTGWNSPRYIAIPESCDERVEELDQLKSSAGIQGAVLANRDRVVEAIQSWTNEALILFTGDGGCGKTTALWQVLRSAADPIASPRRLACLLLSTGTPTQTLEGLVDLWRGSSGTSGTRDDLAIQRLKIASPAAQDPILVLGLDGIDESGHGLQSGAAGRLISFFWNLHKKHVRNGVPPPARLLVSCRRGEDINPFIDPPGLPIMLTHPVDLGQFTTSELRYVLEQTPAISPGIKKRILDAVDAPPIYDFLSPPIGGGMGGETAEYTWISLLRRPIIWSFFARLLPDQQAGLIDGDESAEQAVAKLYLEWFLDRTRRRLNLQEDVVEDALRAIACSCRDLTSPFEFTVWSTEAAAVGLPLPDARKLHVESIGAGFIDAIPPSGQNRRRHSTAFPCLWRYEFFWKYLRGSDL